jgi:DNA-directed RNA polymerase specialized sigma24 family protein
MGKEVKGMIKQQAPKLFHSCARVLGIRVGPISRGEEIAPNKSKQHEQSGTAAKSECDSSSAQKLFESEAFPHLEAIWQTALWLTENETASARLAQNVYLKAFRSWNQMIPRMDCRTLLFKTMAQLYFDGRNNNQPLPEPIPADDFDEGFFYDRPSLLRAIPSHIISRAMRGLLAEIRFVTILSLFWRFSYSEIADIVGIQLEAVKSRLQLGRRLIRRELIEYMISANGLDVIDFKPRLRGALN